MLQYTYPQLQFPKDEYKQYSMLQLYDFQDSFDEERTYKNSDCDHMRFPIGTEDLDKVTGPFVRLANACETGTSPFGERFLLLTRDPVVACEMQPENDTTKSRLLHVLQTREDRGVIGHPNPNVLSKTFKNMAAHDFIRCLLGANIDHLWFMNFGMKARDLATEAFQKLEKVVKKEWVRLDRDARTPQHPNRKAPRNTVCDISADFCPDFKQIILCGKFDLRTAGFAPRKRAGFGSHAESLTVHQMLTGLSDTRMGSATF